MKTGQQNQLLSEIAVKPTFRIIDGVSIRFVESNSGPRKRSIAQSMTRECLRLRSYMVELGGNNALGRTPVQIIAGREDAVVPSVNAEYLHERLPHSELICSMPATSCGRTPPTNMPRS